MGHDREQIHEITCPTCHEDFSVALDVDFENVTFKSRCMENCESVSEVGYFLTPAEIFKKMRNEMELNLEGKCALITGASSAGIGAGIARCLAREGVHVAVTSRRAELLENLADCIAADGLTRPVAIAGDITNPDDVKRIIAVSNTVLGQVDILVNAAGGSRPMTPEIKEEVWEESFALNFTASRRMAEEVLPSMKDRQWGRIINISGSMEPRSTNAAFAAKAAIHVWSKGLSCEVAKNGVTVNVIQPGRINSEQILTKLYPTEEARLAFIAANVPIGYFGEPEDIGNLAAYISSPLASYLTGVVFPVDGGMHYYAH